ncbi:hypothetical protein OPT61_g4740 [Boeremia exigua]|uniref:Uncharacterized protein n=1 Tax=Boeremia exigua TaxID=749465 RepID=A0ACC2ICX0_9PLEO|nr:hypothetical protein OPT61_g4740 [Boeremia exigua]
MVVPPDASTIVKISSCAEASGHVLQAAQCHMCKGLTLSQWRQEFQVVIAGSNGYTKLNKPLPTVQDFNNPASLSAAINAPLDNGYDTYNGMRLFNNNPYDPTLCAAACQAQTDYDKAHPNSDGSYKPCNFFTLYILTQNGVPLGTYCALYTRTWDASYATNTGYYDGDDKYEVVNVGSYAITSPDLGAISSQSSSTTTSSSAVLSTSSDIPSSAMPSSPSASSSTVIPSTSSEVSSTPSTSAPSSTVAPDPTSVLLSTSNVASTSSTSPQMPEPTTLQVVRNSGFESAGDDGQFTTSWVLTGFASI